MMGSVGVANVFTAVTDDKNNDIDCDVHRFRLY